MVSKQKNRHIKLLFGVCIHAVALFVCRISIIKYCIKHTCHIIAPLVPAMCRCYFFCWGHSYCGTTHRGTSKPLFSLWNRGKALCCSLNRHFRTALGFLPSPPKIYENVTLSDVSADAAMLCERKFIVTTLNQEKCVQEICTESASYIAIQCIYFCLVKCLFDGAHLMCTWGLIFHLSRKLPIHFILYSHLTFYEKFKWSRRYGLYAFNIRENDP